MIIPRWRPLITCVAGLALVVSNSLAGGLTDFTVRNGMGKIGCFFGGSAAAAVSILALLLFSTFGSLGREDLVPSAKKA